MSRFNAPVKMTLVTSHHDVLSAFKASLLFLSTNLEILCNLCTEKCENDAFKILTLSMAGCVTFCFDG